LRKYSDFFADKQPTWLIIHQNEWPFSVDNLP
jgi:hypothetical protein